MTEQNVSKSIAIVVDDKIYSAPTVNEPIYGGSLAITFSGGTKDAIIEASDLANILSTGYLPYAITFQESKPIDKKL